MSSHKKSRSCCRRHSRIGYDRGSDVKGVSQKIINLKTGKKVEKETNVMVMQYRQKLNGVWATKGPRILNNPLSINSITNGPNVSDSVLVRSGATL